MYNNNGYYNNNMGQMNQGYEMGCVNYNNPAPSPYRDEYMPSQPQIYHHQNQAHDMGYYGYQQGPQNPQYNMTNLNNGHVSYQNNYREDYYSEMNYPNQQPQQPYMDNRDFNQDPYYQYQNYDQNYCNNGYYENNENYGNGK